MLKDALERSKVVIADQQFSWPVIAKSGTNGFGNEVHFYYNYSSAPKEIEYPHASGKELVTGEAVSEGKSVEIGPWDVLIIEEK
jgi:beta-galactosidase